LDTNVISDTDVVIDFFSGIEPIASTIAELIQSNRLALTSITLFELYAGIKGKRRVRQIDDVVSFIPVLPFEKQDAETAAKIYTELKQKGKLIGNQDILIAGICINHERPLITRNTEHFSRISNLQLYPT
jgi:predicted nucleic acid-binding protein